MVLAGGIFVPVEMTSWCPEVQRTIWVIRWSLFTKLALSIGTSFGPKPKSYLQNAGRSSTAELAKTIWTQNPLLVGNVAAKAKTPKSTGSWTPLPIGFSALVASPGTELPLRQPILWLQAGLGAGRPVFRRNKQCSERKRRWVARTKQVFSR